MWVGGAGGFGEVSEAGVGGTLELLEPGQVLLLGQGPLLSLQGPLEGQTSLLEGQLQTALLVKGEHTSIICSHTHTH